MIDKKIYLGDGAYASGTVTASGLQPPMVSAPPTKSVLNRSCGAP